MHCPARAHRPRSTRPPHVPLPLQLAATVAMAAALWPLNAAAQQIYRGVDAQGRVVFTDKPSSPAAPAARPWSAAGTAPKASQTDAAAPPSTAAALPLALREVAQKFPVTFYAAQHCAPCNAARQSLQTRGIPYTERSVDSAQDLEAFTQLSGQAQLPFATIGRQQVLGWNHSEWHNYLNLAGYPAQSALPASWKPAPVTPLAPASAAPAAATAAVGPTPAPAAQAPAAPPPAPLNSQAAPERRPSSPSLGRAVRP